MLFGGCGCGGLVVFDEILVCWCCWGREELVVRGLFLWRYVQTEGKHDTSMYTLRWFVERTSEPDKPGGKREGGFAVSAGSRSCILYVEDRDTSNFFELRCQQLVPDGVFV